MQYSNVPVNVVTRSTRVFHRKEKCAEHPTSLRKDKRIAHRADRRNAKQALKCADYERYEARRRPRLTKYDVS